jgi:hypothetical protein
MMRVIILSVSAICISPSALSVFSYGVFIPALLTFSGALAFMGQLSSNKHKTPCNQQRNQTAQSGMQLSAAI